MKRNQLIEKIEILLGMWQQRCVLLLLMSISLSTLAQTPVEKYGALKVSGNKILDKNNQPVSLAGSSLFWSNAGWGGERFYNAGAVNYLKSDWNATLVRAAMGVEEAGGYLQDKQREKQKVKTVVDAAIAAGIYVIIDWHSHRAESYRAEAISFFTEMAQTYGNKPNVIFEIYNEPLQVSWSNTIKPYAEAVIGAIRATGSNNLVVVGTPSWSQRVDEAANDPITKYSNIAYTLHFYAATHKQSLRDIAQSALNKNIAIFVTEWGSVDASGGGSVDEASTNEWIAFLKKNSISHANWALNDKAEAASALKPGVSATGQWTQNDYTQSGLLVRNIVKNWVGSTTTNPSPGNTAPVAVASATPTSGAAPVNVQFNASRSSDANNDPLSFAWTFGDGSSGTGATPTHTYATAGSYQAKVTVSDGKGGSNQATVTITVTSGSSGGGACTFGTPRSTPLPSIQQSYKYVYVLGTGGPNLSNVSAFTINWDLASKGLWQIAINTTNGQPGYYVDLLSKTSQTFASAQPAITLSGSGFPGLDGAYWVTLHGGNLVLAQKAGGYTIYFSTTATSPCAAAKLNSASLSELESNALADAKVYPIPFNNELNIDLNGIKEVQKVELFTTTGQLVQTLEGAQISADLIRIRINQPGNLFYLRITSKGQTFTRRVVRN